MLRNRRLLECVKSQVKSVKTWSKFKGWSIYVPQFFLRLFGPKAAPNGINMPFYGDSIGMLGHF